MLFEILRQYTIASVSQSKQLISKLLKMIIANGTQQDESYRFLTVAEHGCVVATAIIK